MQPVPSAGNCARATSDWLWFSLAEKVARVLSTNQSEVKQNQSKRDLLPTLHRKPLLKRQWYRLGLHLRFAVNVLLHFRLSRLKRHSNRTAWIESDFSVTKCGVLFWLGQIQPAFGNKFETKTSTSILKRIHIFRKQLNDNITQRVH